MVAIKLPSMFRSIVAAILRAAIARRRFSILRISLTSFPRFKYIIDSLYCQARFEQNV